MGRYVIEFEVIETGQEEVYADSEEEAIEKIAGNELGEITHWTVVECEKDISTA